MTSDYPADTILATAKKKKCDLIVMATHGRRGIRGVLLGSETQRVVTHSKIPVLVYPVVDLTFASHFRGRFCDVNQRPCSIGC